MSIIGTHGWRVRGLFTISGFRHLLPYSTSAAEAVSQTHFMVDFLINSLGFSREEALSVSEKVSHFKSTKNSNSVINFFEQNGFDKTQIRNIISSAPTLLSSRVEKNLKPKFKFLQDLGLSGSHLVKVVSRNPAVFRRGLDTHILPLVNYLTELVGSGEDVVKAMKKSKWWLSSSNVLQKMPANVMLLKECGVSNEKIKKLIFLEPRVFVQKPKWLADVANRVEVELGIPRESPMFFDGLRAMIWNSKSTLQIKFEIFRAFGWTDSDIYTMARKLPSCFGMSEAKIQNCLEFFMKDLGFSSEYLAIRPLLLKLSLEKRVVPRNEVLNILQEKKLLRRKVGLYSVVILSEAKFLQHFLLPYKDEVPNLYQAYIKRMEQ